jgi:hypothetical protein
LRAETEVAYRTASLLCIVTTVSHISGCKRKKDGNETEDRKDDLDREGIESDTQLNKEDTWKGDWAGRERLCVCVCVCVCEIEREVR